MEAQRVHLHQGFFERLDQKEEASIGRIGEWRAGNSALLVENEAIQNKTRKRTFSELSSNLCRLVRVHATPCAAGSTTAVRGSATDK